MGKVGVVVGRFQIDDLHEGHRNLLDIADSQNDKLLIVLGNAHLSGNRLNSLNYPVRVKMLQAYKPNATITFIRNEKEDRSWSRTLDGIINSLYPTDTPTLYGGRDSFITSYRPYGKYATVEVPMAYTCSATERRRELGKEIPTTREGRAGIIYATYDRPDTVRNTVDVAVLSGINNPKKETSIWLGKKPKSDEWVITGGFFDKRDASFEVAARREVAEELPGLEIGKLNHIGSCQIPDWRYKGVEDEFIVTTFYWCEHLWGTTRGGDDIETAQMFPIQDLFDRKIKIIKCHDQLIEMLKNYLEENGYNEANGWCK